MPSEWPEKGGRWTLCETCWSVFAPDDEEACECDLIGESEKSRRIEVVPASRLGAVEAELREKRESMEIVGGAAKAEYHRRVSAESQLSALREALLSDRAVGAAADLIAAAAMGPPVKAKIVAADALRAALRAALEGIE